jgi:hypothetical protein
MDKILAHMMMDNRCGALARINYVSTVWDCAKATPDLAFDQLENMRSDLCTNAARRS